MNDAMKEQEKIQKINVLVDALNIFVTSWISALSFNFLLKKLLIRGEEPVWTLMMHYTFLFIMPVALALSVLFMYKKKWLTYLPLLLLLLYPVNVTFFSVYTICVIVCVVIAYISITIGFISKSLYYGCARLIWGFFAACNLYVVVREFLSRFFIAGFHQEQSIWAEVAWFIFFVLSLITAFKLKREQLVWKVFLLLELSIATYFLVTLKLLD